MNFHIKLRVNRFHRLRIVIPEAGEGSASAFPNVDASRESEPYTRQGGRII